MALPRAYDQALIVRTPAGKRRTLRASEIMDLIELNDDETEVVYRNGTRITVPLAFDTLYDLWVGEEWEGA